MKYTVKTIGQTKEKKGYSNHRWYATAYIITLYRKLRYGGRYEIRNNDTHEYKNNWM